MTDRPPKKPRKPPGDRPRDTVFSVGGKPHSPSDPRVCRHCGERVLDMKYHLGKAHPRPSRDRPADILLDPGTEDALRQIAGLLEVIRELVFKEPLQATGMIDQARQWIQWARDPTRSAPVPRSGSAVPRSSDSKRHMMQAPTKPRP